MRSITLVALAMFFAAQLGCAHDPSPRGWGVVWTVGGTAVAAAGGALLWSASHPDLDTDDDGVDDFPDNHVPCLVGGCLLGGAMIVGGVVLAVVGVGQLVTGGSGRSRPSGFVPPMTRAPRGGAAPVAARAPTAPADAANLALRVGGAIDRR